VTLPRLDPGRRCRAGRIDRAWCGRGERQGGDEGESEGEGHGEGEALGEGEEEGGCEEAVA